MNKKTTYLMKMNSKAAAKKYNKKETIRTKHGGDGENEKECQ
ncbi:MAG: hypothetical protein ACE19K_01120 [Candidatus Karelsulcia muelleri]